MPNALTWEYAPIPRYVLIRGDYELGFVEEREGRILWHDDEAPPPFFHWAAVHTYDGKAAHALADGLIGRFLTEKEARECLARHCLAKTNLTLVRSA